MTETWTVVFLGIIALSTFVMMAIQVGAIIYAARMAKRLETVVTRVEKDIQPIVERLTAVSEEAVRMSQLATQQVERVDVLFGDLSRRAEQTMAVVQQAIITPARESAALFSALRSTFAAIRGLRGNGTGPSRRTASRKTTPSSSAELPPGSRSSSRVYIAVNGGVHCPETTPVSAGSFCPRNHLFTEQLEYSNIERGLR